MERLVALFKAITDPQPQEARLFPHLTVRQNLTYGARFAPRGSHGPSLGHVVDLLGIGKLLDQIAPLWALVDVIRVFQGGLHPRIYVFDRT